jgi:hypothetical protein
MAVEEVHHGLMAVVAAEYMEPVQLGADHLFLLLQQQPHCYMFLEKLVTAFLLGLAVVSKI